MSERSVVHPDLQWQDNGQAMLTGALSQLFSHIDQQLLSMLGDLPFTDHHAPAFLSSSTLKKLDYLHSFPQHATFAVTLEDEDHNLEAFRCDPWDSESAKEQGELRLTKLSPVRQLLTPAACYHIYVHQEGSNSDSASYHTTRCTCYRREKYYLPLRRQWNFSMREFVCIGTQEQMDEFAETVSARVDALLDEWQIPIQRQTARDPFFDPTNNPKYLLQKIQPNKQEWVYTDELAIASINRHRNYFGENFSMQRGGKTAFSACLAFGLERWMATILEHFGHEPEQWPDALRTRR